MLRERGAQSGLKHLVDRLTRNTTPQEFFFAMLERWPDRHLGATTLWAGTNAIYASRGLDDRDVLEDSFNGWFTP
jgi:hypothetical protein